MKPITLVAILLLCLFGTVACKKDTVVPSEKVHEISSVSGPTTASVNTSITLTVTYPYSNGCDFIERFTESRSGNTVTLKAVTKPVRSDAVCTQDAGLRTIAYPFTASATGTYLLRFLKSDGSSIDHSITVQ